jgi:mannosyl-oligosaccharide alpha-1,2-mannosidase
MFPFRWRRYRVFVLFAFITVLSVVRLYKSRSWVPQFEDFEGGNHVDIAPIKTQPPTILQDDKEKVQPLTTRTRVATSTSTQVRVATSTTAPVESTPKSNPVQVPDIVLPDRKPIPPTKVLGNEEEDGLHAVAPPGRQELPTFPAAPTTIHWVKQPEHFPIPTADIIHLPAGKPIKIPKIQHSFNDESTDAKLNREQRQTKVREEFQKAWGGYKSQAWLHDELSPESGGFKDPFCGWAATLVDGLDTLWIMGLQDEFEGAVKAVELLDFTTTPRGNIPVFETTIRYLGGLIAAYDVSGHKYKVLLDKAVELAEILMGVFDTPNRMPMLFYQWKPTFASQPKRADVRSNLAELGSLSMEFTRLAQLTEDHKYYDAVARVTNALSEWQDRGTALGSVFPDNVDASGCNRSVHVQQPMSASGQPAIVPGKIADPPVGYKPDAPGNVPEPKPKKNPQTGTQQNLEFQIAEGQPSTLGKGRIAGWDENQKSSEKKHVKRDGQSSEHALNTTTPTRTIDPITGLPLDIPAAKASVGGSLGNWDCQPQGLEPASSGGLLKFSMGGGQDSTYEYFPKVCRVTSFMWHC